MLLFGIICSVPTLPTYRDFPDFLASPTGYRSSSLPPCAPLPLRRHITRTCFNRRRARNTVLAGCVARPCVGSMGIPAVIMDRQPSSSSSSRWLLINPRSACAARVTVSVCPSVCYHVFCDYAQRDYKTAIPTGSSLHWLHCDFRITTAFKVMA